MNLPYLIAQKLFDCGIRMRDQDDYYVMREQDREGNVLIPQETRDEVGQLVMDHGQSMLLEISTDQIQVMGLVDAARHVAWLQAKDDLTDDVDAALWIIQCQAARDAYTDSKIDHIKDTRSAA